MTSPSLVLWLESAWVRPVPFLPVVTPLSLRRMLETSFLAPGTNGKANSLLHPKGLLIMKSSRFASY
jgi:hypothetical protein